MRWLPRLSYIHVRIVSVGSKLLDFGYVDVIVSLSASNWKTAYQILQPLAMCIESAAHMGLVMLALRPGVYPTSFVNITHTWVSTRPVKLITSTVCSHKVGWTYLVSVINAFSTIHNVRIRQPRTVKCRVLNRAEAVCIGLSKPLCGLRSHLSKSLNFPGLLYVLQHVGYNLIVWQTD